jgi:hypothetical protein
MSRSSAYGFPVHNLRLFQASRAVKKILPLEQKSRSLIATPNIIYHIGDCDFDLWYLSGGTFTWKLRQVNLDSVDLTPTPRHDLLGRLIHSTQGKTTKSTLLLRD